MKRTAPKVPLLCIGNPTIDENVVFGRRSGPRLGGTGAIAALALRRFGNQVIMTGRMGPDLGRLLSPVTDAGVEVLPLPAAATLRFENTYLDPHRLERREQRARSVPPSISAADLRAVLARPLSGVVLGPLTPTDLAWDTLEAVRRSGMPTAIDVQGFLREVSPEGAVRPRAWPEAAECLRGLAFVHAGEEEAAALLDEEAVEPGSARRLAERLQVRAVAITRGEEGAWTWTAEEGQTTVPAYRPGRRVEDPTGCGDIFMAAFFHGRLQGWAASRAGRFAAMAAALNAYSPTLHCASVEEVERALETAGT